MDSVLLIQLRGNRQGGDSGFKFVPLSIGEPTKDSHAATKKYVDDKVNNYLPLAGEL